MAELRRPRQLDIWTVELDKLGPVLAVIPTRDSIAARIDRVVVAPITSTDRGLRSHFPVGQAEGLHLDSVANLDAPSPSNGAPGVARWAPYPRNPATCSATP